MELLVGGAILLSSMIVSNAFMSTKSIEINEDQEQCERDCFKERLIEKMKEEL